MPDRWASQFVPEVGAWLPLLEVLTIEGSAIRWSGRAHSLSLVRCIAVCVGCDVHCRPEEAYISLGDQTIVTVAPGFTDISVTNSTCQRHFD